MKDTKDQGQWDMFGIKWTEVGQKDRNSQKRGRTTSRLPGQTAGK